MKVYISRSNFELVAISSNYTSNNNEEAELKDFVFYFDKNW